MTDLMIVDDFEIFREQLKGLDCLKNRADISLKGEAENGVEALRLLRDNPVDILLTDINMPEMNGLELLKHAKRERLCKCVILMSRCANFEYARKGIVLGAFDYIVKPVGEEAFEKVISRAIGYIYERNIEDCFRPDCQAIAENILTCGTKLDNLVMNLIIKCRKTAGEDFVRTASMLSDSLRQIYSEVTEKRKKIIIVIGNIDEACKLIVQAKDCAEAAEAFTKYTKEIYAAVKNYYPPNMTGLSETAVDYIFDHLFEKMTLTDVSEFCFVSNTYLSHSFKRNMGKSFVDYVTLLKMQAVKKLLTETELNMAEIAERLGYDDCKYMGRIFKNMFGCTLSDYRRMNCRCFSREL